MAEGISYGCKVFMRFVCDYFADNKDRLGVYTAYTNLDPGYKDYGSIAVVTNTRKCMYICRTEVDMMYALYSRTDNFENVSKLLDRKIEEFSSEDH